MNIDFSIAYDIETLSELYLYNTGDSTENISAVRVIFATYNSLSGTSSTKNIKKWTEYKLNQDTIINGSQYPSGSIVILANDFKLTGNDTATPTGYYGERYTWNSSNLTPITVVPSQTGYTTSDTYFADLAFSVRYEAYGAKYYSGTIGAGTYYVLGNEGDYITISGNRFYAGEVVTQATSFTFTNVLGTNALCKLIDSNTGYFATKKNSYEVLQSYIENIANPANVTNNQKLQNDFLTVNALFESINMMEDQDYDVSIEEVQTILDNIIEFWSNLSNVT
jgi:hypothetical protein